MTNIKRLSDAELEIMLLIWDEDSLVTSTAILEKLAGKRDWKLPTLMTVLARLVNKGFLLLEKRGRNNFYAPLISEETYRRAEGKNIFEKLYGSDLMTMVSSLVSSKAVSDEDLQDLRNYLNELDS